MPNLIVHRFKANPFAAAAMMRQDPLRLAPDANVVPSFDLTLGLKSPVTMLAQVRTAAPARA